MSKKRGRRKKKCVPGCGDPGPGVPLTTEEREDAAVKEFDEAPGTVLAESGEPALDRPAMWIWYKLNDGRLHKVSAEKIAEIMTARAPEVKDQATIAQLVLYPGRLIKWAEKNLTWLDVARISIQTQSNVVMDPAEDWKTCEKGYVCEGERI